jgi:hypothetical protein
MLRPHPVVRTQVRFAYDGRTFEFYDSADLPHLSHGKEAAFHIN